MSRVRRVSGPVPSCHNEAKYSVDFFAKPNLPTSVEDLCAAEEADLNESALPLLPPNGNNGRDSFIVNIGDPNEDSSGFSSFSSNRSDEADSNSTGVDSSQKKLMSSPDASKIEMNKNDDSDDEMDFVQTNPVLRCIVLPIEMFSKFVTLNKRLILLIFGACLALGVTAYMVAALITNFQRALTLLVIWLVVVVYNMYALLRDNFGDSITHHMRPVFKSCGRNMFWIQCRVGEDGTPVYSVFSSHLVVNDSLVLFYFRHLISISR